MNAARFILLSHLMRQRLRQLALVFAGLVLSSSHLFASDPVAPQRTQPVVTIPRLDHAPKLEDFLGMKPGPNAPAMAKVTNFIQKDPKDGAPAQQKTDVYLGYDNKTFYAVFVCFDSDPH